MPQTHPPSYWAATADAAPAMPALEYDTEADAVIVGAGFTGLSAAYRLAMGGRSCVVLEANDVAWGASGRNGGMVVPRFKHTYPVLAARYGVPAALDMYRLAHRAVDLIEQIVRDERIDCGFSRSGHITPVVRAPDAARLEADARWLEREAHDRAPLMLGRSETERRIGTRFYADGYLEPRGGGIHPLRFAHGLAAAVLRRGGRIFTRTAAQSWRRDGHGVVVETARARVRARQLLLAMNSYADISAAGDQLKRRVVPVVSSLIATEPLDVAVRGTILPLGNVVTDAKRLTNYFRLSPEGRLLFGGRGGASGRESERTYRRLAREMAAIFPQLRSTPLAFRWAGRVAVTLDGLPRVGRLDDNVIYAMGYNGRGVALSVMLGHVLAGDPPDVEALGPLGGPLGHIPFHALQLPAKQLVISYCRLLDALGR